MDIGHDAWPLSFMQYFLYAVPGVYRHVAVVAWVILGLGAWRSVWFLYADNIHSLHVGHL